MPLGKHFSERVYVDPLYTNGSAPDVTQYIVTSKATLNLYGRVQKQTNKTKAV